MKAAESGLYAASSLFHRPHRSTRTSLMGGKSRDKQVIVLGEHVALVRRLIPNSGSGGGEVLVGARWLQLWMERDGEIGRSDGGCRGGSVGSGGR